MFLIVTARICGNLFRHSDIIIFEISWKLLLKFRAVAPKTLGQQMKSANQASSYDYFHFKNTILQSSSIYWFLCIFLSVMCHLKTAFTKKIFVIRFTRESLSQNKKWIVLTLKTWITRTHSQVSLTKAQLAVVASTQTGFYDWCGTHVMKLIITLGWLESTTPLYSAHSNDSRCYQVSGISQRRKLLMENLILKWTLSISGSTDRSGRSHCLQLKFTFLRVTQVDSSDMFIHFAYIVPASLSSCHD